MPKQILLAGATGRLGGKIAAALLKHGASVRAVVRNSTDTEKIDALKKLGVEVVMVSVWDKKSLLSACQGIDCVVSALSGLHDVIIDAQTALLDAAVAAGVSRFIPSDYALDFTRFRDGENRNLDLRRTFHTYLDRQPIRATSIFNGAFMEMLTDEMPLVLLKQRRILCWGSPDKRYDFTHTLNIAEFTALAALDNDTPRYLYIAGEQITPRGILDMMAQLTGQPFKLFRPGGQGLLGFVIRVAKLFGGQKELYPAWQGMQYMHNMIDTRLHMDAKDRERYPGIKWISVREVLATMV
jgi:nucleoside-diphosphate-sugar epimerase